MPQAIRLRKFRSPDLHSSDLCPFPQTHVEHHIGEHVGFIELRLWLDLSSEVAHGDEEIDEISSSFRDGILFVRCLIGNVDDLQEPRKRKPLGCARKVEDSEVKRGL